ncbi:hypothetical protein SpCBS45565_g04058 [Spizellomyces sp. 'palustris']|nr:hypothetical protein SpCBS45565_g04058 [Spizellomyces sp. 'palustris']
MSSPFVHPCTLPIEIIDEILTHLPIHDIFTLGKVNRELFAYVGSRVKAVVKRRLDAAMIQRKEQKCVEWLRGAIKGVRADLDWVDDTERTPCLRPYLKTLWKGYLSEKEKAILSLTPPTTTSSVLPIIFLSWTVRYPMGSSWQTIYSTHLYMDVPASLCAMLGLPPNTVQVQIMEVTKYQAKIAKGVVVALTECFNRLGWKGTVPTFWEGLLDGTDGRELVDTHPCLQGDKVEKWTKGDTNGCLNERFLDEHESYIATLHPALPILRALLPHLSRHSILAVLDDSDVKCTDILHDKHALLKRCQTLDYPLKGIEQKYFDAFQRIEWKGGSWKRTPIFDDWYRAYAGREDDVCGEIRGVTCTGMSLSVKLNCYDYTSYTRGPHFGTSFRCTSPSETMDLLTVEGITQFAATVGLADTDNDSNWDDRLLYVVFVCCVPCDIPMEWVWALWNEVERKVRASGHSVL